MIRVFLIDGTFELFRCFFGAPRAKAPDGREVGATRGLLRSLWSLRRTEAVTHAGVAFDTVIESFRNQLYHGYKTGEGLEAELTSQFPLAEEAARALGLTVWPMIELEADDALASAAALCAADPEVEQVVIASPDKDFGQCLEGRRVVCLDRIRKRVLDADSVVARFGVGPASIPDYLALVGDSADGIPGLPGFGPKTAALLLSRYLHLEDIPADPAAWDTPSPVRGAARLAQTLEGARDTALLYRTLATLRTDAPLGLSSTADLVWTGPRMDLLEPLCRSLGDARFLDQVAESA